LIHTNLTGRSPAGNPDSTSGKAKKAREYGIPIINEEALTRLLGRS
jgi:DNA polymerase-3 subunit epsilon